MTLVDNLRQHEWTLSESFLLVLSPTIEEKQRECVMQ
jgi:hypothetical protein